MGYVSRAVAGLGARRVLFALGGAYAAVAVGIAVTQTGEQTVGEALISPLLLATSGLVLSYCGYRLPRTNVRPDLFHVVASWCLRAFGVMFGIALSAELLGSLDDPVSGFVVLPSLASVAGLGMGYHDAKARTRALDAEERQREAERYSRELERYHTIVETVNDGIFVVDEESRFTLVNDAYTELVGYDREELVGSPSSLVAAEETDVDAMSREVSHDLGDGTAETKTYESIVRTASGERKEVESTVAVLPEQDDAAHDKVVVVRDITERNERERQLEQQNERLDSFASLLAHELRNPVTIGQIYSQQLPAEADSGAVEYVTEAFDRIEDMIDVMLVVTRGREALSESAPVELADAAREAWNEVDAPDATLEVEIDRTIEADETYVRHLFRNLFENAVEHGGPQVTVTVGELPTGFYVADDGTGIPTDQRDAVFETGYTTAGSNGGMGLGLTFVNEMADVYEWDCSVTESETGGARFEFANATEAVA
ncbi:PAS domain S-box protein (plasmid) [Halorussus limi]|uniref:histidine kinase n=1 Tax=Halorussus limi TaxID=2938695 RepID=A0A8U0I083_9EURY|nr:PAS domain S-box protein [Halorussus limi]UPV76346.1 PAS domain S-box protein [Halorussus limi]